MADCSLTCPSIIIIIIIILIKMVVRSRALFEFKINFIHTHKIFFWQEYFIGVTVHFLLHLEAHNISLFHSDVTLDQWLQQLPVWSIIHHCKLLQLSPNGISHWRQLARSIISRVAKWRFYNSVILSVFISCHSIKKKFLSLTMWIPGNTIHTEKAG